MTFPEHLKPDAPGPWTLPVELQDLIVADRARVAEVVDPSLKFD